MKQKLYSYQRWSSAVQAEGTTKARQTNAAEAYAALHDLEMVEIIDDGISGFRSANFRSGGALGQFLDAVDQGLIPSNAFLYVESLDRITREEIDVALELFLGILRRGITVYTGMDNHTYTRESIKGNPIDLLTSILLFSRAHEESKTKQKRTNDAALVLIESFKKGNPVTIKAVGSHPWWIDASTNANEAVKQHPIMWPIAVYAINRFLEGDSVFKVTKALNEQYPNTYKNGPWRYENVRKLTVSESVYGLRIIHINDVKYELPGYFPAMITEGQFLRLGQIRETFRYLGDAAEKGIKNNINLLAGLKLFRCGHCGGTMMAMRQNDTIRYMCCNGRTANFGCRVWSLPGLLVEHTLMIVTTIAYINLQQKGYVEQQDYTQQLESTEKLIADIGSRISRATTLVINGLGSIEEVQSQLQQLSKQRANLVAELEVLQRKQILSKDTTFESLMMDFFTYAQYGVLQDPVHDYRTKLRDIVRTSIGDARAWKYDRRLYLSFQIKGQEDYYNFSSGKTPYDWGCYYGTLPFAVDSDKATNHTEVEEHAKAIQAIADSLPEEFRSRVIEEAKVYERANMDMLKQALELLSTVHYPELDGKMFWPRK